MADIPSSDIPVSDLPNPDVSIEPVASSLRQVIGALLFSSPVPLNIEAVRKCLKDMPKNDDGTPAPFSRVLPRDIYSAILDIQQDLERLGLGVSLAEVGGGYRFQTQAGCGRWVRALLKRDKPARLSRSALETLAIIAYRQPVAKSEIEGIRGVTVDHIIRPLMEMHLIRIVGRSDLPGRPFLYGTTPLFLEHFGLRNLEELKEIDPTLKRDRKGDDDDLFKAKNNLDKATEPVPDKDVPIEQTAAETVSESDTAEAQTLNQTEENIVISEEEDKNENA